MRASAYPRMKPSGVEWLGDIPEHWQVKRVKYAADIVMGQSPSSESYSLDESERPFLQGNAEFGVRFPNAKWFCDAAPKTVPAGALLLSVRAPVGALNEADQQYAIGRGLCGILDVGKRLTKSFGWYVFQICKSDLDAKATGSTYEAVSVADVGSLQVGLPSIEDQRRIASFLDAATAKLDRLVMQKQELIDKLHEKRTALISHVVTRGLDPSVKLKPSGIEWLGDIPEHWGVQRLKFELMRIEQGWSPQCDNSPADEDEWGVLKAGAVNGTEFDPTENKRLPDEETPLPEYEIHSGDFLISRANTRALLGSAGIVRNTRPRLLLCDKLYRLTLRTRAMNAEYLLRFMRSIPGHYEFERDASGSSASMQNIGQESVRNLWVPLPPLAEQAEIVGWLDVELASLDQLVVKVEKAIERLREYRNAIITAAVTGKVDLRQGADAS